MAYGGESGDELAVGGADRNRPLCVWGIGFRGDIPVPRALPAGRILRQMKWQNPPIIAPSDSEPPALELSQSTPANEKASLGVSVSELAWMN